MPRRHIHDSKFQIKTSTDLENQQHSWTKIDRADGGYTNIQLLQPTSRKSNPRVWDQKGRSLMETRSKSEPTLHLLSLFFQQNYCSLLLSSLSKNSPNRKQTETAPPEDEGKGRNDRAIDYLYTCRLFRVHDTWHKWLTWLAGKDLRDTISTRRITPQLHIN